MLLNPAMKRPLNTLENPVYPNIKKGPPRFINSRKHWVVDDTVISASVPEDYALQDAVLYQSRDQSRITYGVSSHRDYVNEEFRPPIQTMEDLEPLSRLRRKTVWGRINPSVEGFEPNNNTPQSLQKYFTKGIKDVRSRPEQSREMGSIVGRPEYTKKFKIEIPKHAVVSQPSVRFDTPLIRDYTFEEKITQRGDSGVSGYSTLMEQVGASPHGQEKILGTRKIGVQGLSYSERPISQVMAAPEHKYGEKMNMAGTASISVEYEPYSELGVSMKSYKEPITAQALSRSEYGYVPDTSDILVQKRVFKKAEGNLRTEKRLLVTKDGKFHQIRREKPKALQTQMGMIVPDGMHRTKFLDPTSISICTKKIRK